MVVFLRSIHDMKTDKGAIPISPSFVRLAAVVALLAALGLAYQESLSDHLQTVCAQECAIPSEDPDRLMEEWRASRTL